MLNDMINICTTVKRYLDCETTFGPAERTDCFETLLSISVGNIDHGKAPLDPD